MCHILFTWLQIPFGYTIRTAQWAGVLALIDNLLQPMSATKHVTLSRCSVQWVHWMMKKNGKNIFFTRNFNSAYSGCCWIVVESISAINAHKALFTLLLLMLALVASWDAITVFPVCVCVYVYVNKRIKDVPEKEKEWWYIRQWLMNVNVPAPDSKVDFFSIPCLFSAPQ